MTDMPSQGGDKIVLAVDRRNYRSQISNVLAVRKMLKDRDIGSFIGIPEEDWVRGKPHTIKLTVHFCNFKLPPFRKRLGEPFVKATYNIPDVKRTSLNWATIKTACGGTNGYLWGRFRATAKLDNGRLIQIYGGSESEADDRLKALVALSDAKLLTTTISEEKKEGRRAINKRMYKDNTRVYPTYFSVMNYEKIEVEDEREFSGINAKLAGTFRRTKTEKIPLWVDTEPTTTDKIIREALRVRGTSGS